MKNIILKTIIFSAICFATISASTTVLAYQNPTANAGPDLYVNSGQSVVLQGSGFDPQSSSLTYYWNCSGGTLSNYNIAQPTFTAPNNYNQTYTCSLTVTNSYSLSNSDSVIINVNNNGNNNYNGNYSVQTNFATYIQNNSATLNGTLSINNSTSYNYTGALVWFQWGTDTNYGSSSFQQSLSTGTFVQQINNLISNQTYHFRAAAQVNGQTIYGQDMTFNSNGSNNNNNYYYGSTSLNVTKQVINLTSGNLNWQSSVTAKPGDILTFAITLQPNGQDIHNVFIRDILPPCLIYRGNSTLNASVNSLINPTLGVSLGTISGNGIEIISYQVQVASASQFTYGTTTLSNSATVTSTETGSQTASASAIVYNNQTASGPTSISTGETNNPVTDSFLLPILLIILMSWLYFTGRVYDFADWLGERI